MSLPITLPAHKTERVTEFLQTYRHVHLYFISTYSSWLNQVKLWFAKIEHEVIARGIFTSVKDLARKLLPCIRQDNKAPKAVKWKNYDRTRRIGS